MSQLIYFFRKVAFIHGLLWSVRMLSNHDCLRTFILTSSFIIVCHVSRTLPQQGRNVHFPHLEPDGTKRKIVSKPYLTACSYVCTTHFVQTFWWLYSALYYLYAHVHKCISNNTFRHFLILRRSSMHIYICMSYA